MERSYVTWTGFPSITTEKHQERMREGETALWQDQLPKKITVSQYRPTLQLGTRKATCPIYLDIATFDYHRDSVI